MLQCKSLKIPSRSLEKLRDRNVHSLRLRKPDELKLLLSEIWSQTKILCRGPYLRNTILTCGIQFCLTARWKSIPLSWNILQSSCFFFCSLTVCTFCSYYTLMVWFPELFQRFDIFEEKNPGVSASVCDVSSIVVSNRFICPLSNPKNLPRTFYLTALLFVDFSTIDAACDQQVDEKVFLHTIIIGLACVPTSFWLPLCVHRLGVKFFLGN